MSLTHSRMERLTDGLPTKAAKIRALDQAGCTRSEIAKFLGIRYQHVRNVLVRPAPKTPRVVPQGFAEASSQPDQLGIPSKIELKIGPDGRIVVPSQVRQAMEIEEGGALLAWLEDGELRLISPAIALRRAQDLVCDLIPKTVDLAGELIADRRKEVARERDDG